MEQSFEPLIGVQDKEDSYQRREVLEPDHEYSKTELSKAHLNLAKMLIRLEDVNGAKVHYIEALNIDPNNLAAHYGLAIALRILGDTQGSLQHLEDVLRIEPDNAGAHHVFASILTEEGNLEGARHHLAELIKIDPDNINIYISVWGTFWSILAT